MCPPSNACDCDGKENVDQLEAAITPTPSFVKAHGVLRGETVALEGGATYSGELSSNLRHGQGILVSSDGSRYEGGWMHDRAHGEGRLELPSG